MDSYQASISPFVNVKALQEFELSYFDATDHHFTDYAKETPTTPCVILVSDASYLFYNE